MSDIVQFDPALKELLLRKTGSLLGETAGEDPRVEQVPVVAKLKDPAAPVDSLEVVAAFGPVVTGRVPMNRLAAVRQHQNVVSLKASLEIVPELAYSVPEIEATQEAMERRAGLDGLTGRGVIVGVVDWGCDFAHANFRDRDGRTRLLYLWDQRGGSQPDSPAPFAYGREFQRGRIDAALAEPDPYAALRYDPADADRDGSGAHGTCVLDIAAGNGRAPGASPGVAPDAELIFVHLKGDDTRPQDTLGDSVRLLEAVRYIVDRAGYRPVAINMSLGSTGGPHDASPLLVQGLDALLAEAAGRIVTMSAGNYYSAHLHSGGRLGTGEQVDLNWNVSPRNDEIAELEVWYSGTDAFVIELIDPRGRSLAQVPLGESRVVEEAGRIIASIHHRRHDPNNGDNQVDLFLWPDAMLGTWTTRLIGETVTDGRYHAWIERDDPASQSRFTPDCATPTHTTGTLCNGRRTIAVGAYDAREPSRALGPFSSAGPSRDERTKPDCSAPGVGVRAARSSQPDLFGEREMDRLTIKSGTSMAAPHVTGLCALVFQAAGDVRLEADETSKIVIETSRSGPPFGEDDRPRYGAGRVDAAAAAAATRVLVDAKRAGLAEARRAHLTESVGDKPDTEVERLLVEATELLAGLARAGPAGEPDAPASVLECAGRDGPETMRGTPEVQEQAATGPLGWLFDSNSPGASELVEAKSDQDDPVEWLLERHGSSLEETDPVLAWLTGSVSVGCAAPVADRAEDASRPPEARRLADLVSRASYRTAFHFLNGLSMSSLLGALRDLDRAGNLSTLRSQFGHAVGVDAPRLLLAMDVVQLSTRPAGLTPADVGSLRGRMTSQQLPADQQADIHRFLAPYLAGRAQPDAQPAPARAAANRPAAPAGTVRYALSTDPVVVVKADAKKGLAEVREAPADYTRRILQRAGLDADTWFSSFTTMSFLGRTIAPPIHSDFATHLAGVERELARRFGGDRQDPALAGRELGLNENIGGARTRPTGAPFSMHLFGLAIDVNYTSNPWISESANPVFERAGLLVRGAATRYRPGMSYDELKALNDTLVAYFALLDRPDQLDVRLASAGDPWRGKSSADARRQIDQDLSFCARRWERERAREVIKQSGFLNLRKEMVEAMGLDWGASYGDIMHFDMRNRGRGADVHRAVRWYAEEKLREARQQGTAGRAASPAPGGGR
jgi:subtilisin family serine protease